jgi:hypothetical protein
VIVPARVTITRTDDSDVQQRQVIVRIDTGQSTTLYYGDSVTLDVPAGEHRLRVHNTLVWKHVTFVAADDEHVEFTVINRSGRLSFGLLALVGAAPLFLTVRQRRLTAADQP